MKPAKLLNRHARRMSCQGKKPNKLLHKLLSCQEQGENCPSMEAKQAAVEAAELSSAKRELSKHRTRQAAKLPSVMREQQGHEDKQDAA